MRDDFNLLHRPRRPWLDPEDLKSQFLSLSSEVHPDRSHGAGAGEQEAANRRFAELNSAYNRLRDPRERLLHLLELELGSKPGAVQVPPPEITELGFNVGQLCHQVDRFLIEQAAVTSPMVRVQMFEQAQAWSDRLTAIREEVTARREALIGEIKTLNAAWESAETSGAGNTSLPLGRLEEIYTLLSYENRWISQLQEHIVQLCL